MPWSRGRKFPRHPDGLGLNPVNSQYSFMQGTDVGSVKDDAILTPMTSYNKLKLEDGDGSTQTKTKWKWRTYSDI